MRSSHSAYSWLLVIVCVIITIFLRFVLFGSLSIAKSARTALQRAFKMAIDGSYRSKKTPKRNYEVPMKGGLNPFARLSGDIHVHIGHFLSAPDIAKNMALTCKTFGGILIKQDRAIWGALASGLDLSRENDFSNVFRVPAIEEPGKKEKDCTESSPLALAMFFKDSVFEVDTFKDLYEIWSQLRVPFVSLWKRPPNDMRVDFRGQLMRMTVGAKSMILEDVSPTGITSPAFTLRVIRIKKNFALAVEASEGSWRFEHYKEKAGFSLHNDRGTSYSFLPLPTCLHQVQMPVEVPHHDVIRKLLGLWRGAYGSHGYEILLLEYRECPSVVRQITGPCLEGEKIVGDANVLGGKLSFVAFLDKPFSVQELLQRDDRGIYNVVEDLMEARNLRDEASEILCCFPGHGQINRIQGQWDPRWTRLDVLVYKRADDTVSFSLLWDDMGFSLRHIIDFEPFSLLPCRTQKGVPLS